MTDQERIDAERELALAYAERGLEPRNKPIRELPTFEGWTDSQIADYLESL
jgi:hypothetical protein